MQAMGQAVGKVADLDEEVLHDFLRPSLREIRKRLRELGAVKYDLWLPETRSLPHVIRPAERIEGVVYGRYVQPGEHQTVGRGVFVATDQRLLLLDKKPLFVRCDEIPYEVVGGVTYSKVPLAVTLVLHSRTGDISLRTFNERCARGFVDALEERLRTRGTNHLAAM